MDTSKEVKEQKVENNKKETPPSTGPKAVGGGGVDNAFLRDFSKRLAKRRQAK